MSPLSHTEALNMKKKKNNLGKKNWYRSHVNVYQYLWTLNCVIMNLDNELHH